jgi:uroporphyrinogen III methyltransferase/synthase
MGTSNLPIIVAKLIAHGRAAKTPAAVIRRGTTGEQETVIGTLADIADKSARLKPPALIVIGEIVSLADKLHWFDPMPYNLACDGIRRESEPARA